MHVAKLIEIGSRQSGVLHRRQLRANGVSRSTVARYVDRGALRPVGADALVLTNVPPSWEQRLWTGLLTAQHRAVISHRSAARIHGIGRFAERHIDVLEVGAAPHLAIASSAHRSTTVPEHHRTEVRGLPVTTIPRTVFDLASQVSIKRYRRGLPSLRLGAVARALDDAIGGGTPVARFQEVLDELGGRGRGGTVVLRTLLDERGEGFVATESELEDLLAEVLDYHRLPRPTRQRNVGGLEERIGRVDFLYQTERVVIEADGRKNHTALLDREGDAWRDLELTAAGFTVVRVTWRQLKNDPKRFVTSLERVLAASAVR